jgi:alpha-L-rhamnosidase
MSSGKFTRRDFFKTGAIGGASLLLITGAGQEQNSQIDYNLVRLRKEGPKIPSRYHLDLAPARWIWYPSQRTLANTFILFRKTLRIDKKLQSAKGWILGDSRYLLLVNGKRIQWGPPPADPRFTEADPVDLTPVLNTGENVIGANVLYFGYGDGTWPVGKPGFIFYLKLTFDDNSEQLIISDNSWSCHLARSWKPGQFKRWYLRSLQEDFDARKYPFGWNSNNFNEDNSWIKAVELRGSAAQTALSSGSSDYMYDASNADTVTELRKRTIPMILESKQITMKLMEACEIGWKRPSEEYFEMIVPDAYEVKSELSARTEGPWEFSLENDKAIVLTFAAHEQMVGWPFFNINAPEGTTIELMVQEGHILYREGGPAIINNHHHSWTRFTCNKGDNYFETFDFESVKWMQLHIHGAKGKIVVDKPGIRRRMYDWPNPPMVKTSDKDMQKIIDACLNTTYNNSLDTIVDGMGRERQQYSGDIGHMLHVHYRVFGEQKLPARYLNTYSQGLTHDGFFLDTWPAYDRLNRLAQRQLDLTKWGPLLDHGVGFNFDSYHHYLYTGDLSELEEVWPRLKRFFYYLKSIAREDGMLPVEDIGIPAVWIDHDAYKLQRHKQCAFNMYAIAMMKFAFSPLAVALGEGDISREAIAFAEGLYEQVKAVYWDSSKSLFICNKPWRNEEGEERLCDRSLATAILFDLFPNNSFENALEVLIQKPENLGLSYPPNTNWYLWALGKKGKIDAIFNDFETRWIKLNSIHQNNTMQEMWHVIPDSGSQWSHAAIAPLITVFSDLAGIQPLKPGYKSFRIQPNPGKLELLELSNYTPSGPIEFALSGKKGKRKLTLKIPKGISGELVLDEREKLKLKELYRRNGKKAYELAGGQEVSFNLKYT